MAPKKTVELSELEAIELEYKRMQIDRMREEMGERQEKKERLTRDRERQALDFKKSESERLRRQSICKHRKGGRNNNFAKGSDANYSINQNTYPNGDMCISCTRCGKEVWKPRPELRKTNRELYNAMWAEWQKWLEYPTDNSPSGSKIFEVIPAA
ncbi:MAG TPA: hypothetical protein VL498_07015 [Terracidiphilus sp.]|nr:hypothetical protein [Terracidiphilus sp.]